MILLNDQQKSEFKKLSQLLLNAETNDEISYYSDKIHKILDEAETSDTDEHKLNDEQLEKYREYKRSLLDATSINEILYFENKIMELIDESNILSS